MNGRQTEIETMTSLFSDFEQALIDLRQQGMKLSDINPVSAMADIISDKLYHNEIDKTDIQSLLDEMGQTIWTSQAEALAKQSGLSNLADCTLPDMIAPYQEILSELPLDKPRYRAVFTAHPVFALQPDNSAALCRAAHELSHKKTITPPNQAYQPRETVSLSQEHDEAMLAQTNARKAIQKLNRIWLQIKAKQNNDTWRDTLPTAFGISTWVGYDLDGRSDITWLDSLILRLQEKHRALSLYHDALAEIAVSELSECSALLEKEMADCAFDIDQLTSYQNGAGDFATIMNAMTERDKLTKSRDFADRLHEIAKHQPDDELALSLLVVAADIATHGFGMGEIHLRINAVQLRNAMRSLDGRGLSSSDGNVSARLLMDRLASRIKQEAPWHINYASVDKETATARRQLMLAAQFIKHIDNDQPVRLLIAECERPITYMSALYLAHKFDIADKLDISPLFETTFGLEHGAEMMSQLFTHEVVRNYVIGRGRVAIQLGFSDAGRFMGQIAANLAIERLQIKITDLVANHFDQDCELLIFNTHGESLGRGCARPTIKDRQNFILTPFARARVSANSLALYHQSSFQGGDGYRLFGSQALADSTMAHLLIAEITPPSDDWLSDPFYEQNDFSLDLFLSLKNWHETLFANPQYGDMLDVFGSNLLPKTGSRPAKRVVQAGNERSDPSKIRAIPHNAILQQLGFLAIVISGMGSAARIDTERFCEIHKDSPRLRQAVEHILNAKENGSLNTILAYARMTDNGFWVSRAYHGTQYHHQRAYRQLAASLKQSRYSAAMKQTVWRLREDLIDLYRLTELLDLGSIRMTGDERIMPDLLHALRLALIMDSLVRVAKVPRFAETNRHSNADLMNAAIKLDFETVCAIVEEEFPENKAQEDHKLAEAETYAADNLNGYRQTREQILAPLLKNQALIRQISQMVSALHLAHG